MILDVYFIYGSNHPLLDVTDITKLDISIYRDKQGATSQEVMSMARHARRKWDMKDVW